MGRPGYFANLKSGFKDQVIAQEKQRSLAKDSCLVGLAAGSERLEDYKRMFGGIDELSSPCITRLCESTQRTIIKSIWQEKRTAMTANDVRTTGIVDIKNTFSNTCVARFLVGHEKVDLNLMTNIDETSFDVGKSIIEGLRSMVPEGTSEEMGKLGLQVSTRPWAVSFMPRSIPVYHMINAGYLFPTVSFIQWRDMQFSEVKIHTVTCIYIYIYIYIRTCSIFIL